MSARTARGKRLVTLLGVLAGMALAETATAAPAMERPFQSSRWGSFALSLGGYTPRIDSEFSGVTPYQTAFGSGRHYMARADFSYSLFVDYGTLDVGAGVGFAQATGHGLLPDGTVSADLTRFRVPPARVHLTYYIDQIATRYPIPLVPYVRLSLDRYWWWVYNGSGSTANAAGKAGSGATNGYSLSGGMALLLDFLDPGLAREMDRDTGINHTYLFVDFTKSYVNGFGSASSWDLSDDRITISGGLLFQF